MSEADDLLRSGDLPGARRVLVEAARKEPGHVPTRLFLFQLLALAGEWAKARTQLQTLAQLSPEAQMLSVVYGQAIDAEATRAAVLAGAERIYLFAQSDWLESFATALQQEASGDTDAQAIREAALDAAPDTPGDIDGTRFEWIADADPRFGPAMELILNGRYGLLPFEAVSKIESEGPRDLRDLVWYPVEITLRHGPKVAALVPTRYPGLSDGPAEQLARATSWGDDGRGSGQRVWITSDDEERGLLSVRSVRLD